MTRIACSIALEGPGCRIGVLARPPSTIPFAAASLVVARRLPALARRGDTLFTTAVETTL